MADGQVLSTASIQCATILALDDLDENTVNLAAHVPDFGFSTWEEFVAGQFKGEFNAMANLTVSDVIARSGQDIPLVGIDFRIQCDFFRGGTDSATQRGRFVILGRGADSIDQNGGFERIEVGWERVSSTLVSIQYRRFNAADAQQEGAQIGANFTFAINTGLRMFVTYAHPNITVHTAPSGQNSPLTLIGSIAITGDIRGTPNQRIGISSGAASSNRTFTVHPSKHRNWPRSMEKSTSLPNSGWMRRRNVALCGSPYGKSKFTSLIEWVVASLIAPRPMGSSRSAICQFGAAAGGVSLH